MHLSLKGSLKSSLIFTYVKTDQALDLGNLAPFTIPDLSGNANTATLYTGIYVSTNGTTDKAIGANATALGSGNYYLSGKIKPAGTTAKTTMDGSTASNLTGLTAGVWQDFQTATASAITPSSINLGWDGTAFNATVDNWSDVKLHNASDDSVVAHWKLYDSADASLDGYPALDCVGGYHGAHVGCAGGSGEPDILQTAGEDFNINTTTYVGKTVYVAQSEVTQGVDALGNSITNPRPNERVLNLTTGTGYATVADSASLDLTTEATWEVWPDFRSTGSERYILSKYDTGGNNRSWAIGVENSVAGSNTLNTSFGDPANGTFEARLDWAITEEVACYHIIYDGSLIGTARCKLYKNGVLVALSASTANPPASLRQNNIPVLVGGIYIAGVISNIFDEQLGDIRIYSRALTADEVLKNYNARKSAYGL